MTDSASESKVTYHVNRDAQAGSTTKEGWTRDPLYSCSGHVEDGGTCLVHSPQGISVTLAPRFENLADWKPPDEESVRRVMSDIAFECLDKQLSTLLDLYDIKEKEHRTSISKSVFARKDEDGWPFTINGEPFSPDLFKFFQARAEAAMPTDVCADLTLVPHWSNLQDPSNAIFHPMVHLVLREGPISAAKEGENQTVATHLLAPANVSDSARLPYNSDKLKTPRGAYEFMSIGTRGPTPSKPTSIDQRSQDAVSKLVMTQKERKHSIP